MLLEAFALIGGGVLGVGDGGNGGREFCDKNRDETSSSELSERKWNRVSPNFKFKLCGSWTQLRQKASNRAVSIWLKRKKFYYSWMDKYVTSVESECGSCVLRKMILDSFILFSKELLARGEKENINVVINFLYASDCFSPLFLLFFRLVFPPLFLFLLLFN